MTPNENGNKTTFIEQIGCFSIILVSIILNLITPLLIIIITNYIFDYEVLEICVKNYLTIYAILTGGLIFLTILTTQLIISINKIKSIWKKQKK